MITGKGREIIKKYTEIILADQKYCKCNFPSN